jgi:hypothetical protein
MNEVHFSDRWRDSPKFDSYGRFVSKEGKYVSEDYPGCKYKVCVKKERYYTLIERTSRVFLGLLATILTIGAAPVLSKNVRALFTRQKKVLVFAIKVIGNNPSIVKLPEINLPAPLVADPNAQAQLNRSVRYPPQPVPQIPPVLEIPLPILEI